jgi:hypothetical protein
MHDRVAMSRIRAVLLIAIVGSAACAPFRSSGPEPDSEDPVAKKSTAPATPPGQTKPQEDTTPASKDPAPLPDTNPSPAPPEKEVYGLPQDESDCAEAVPLACRSCCMALGSVKGTSLEKARKIADACMESLCDQ